MQISGLLMDVTDVIPQSELPFSTESVWDLIGDKDAKKRTEPLTYPTVGIEGTADVFQREANGPRSLCGLRPLPIRLFSIFLQEPWDRNASHRFPKDKHHRERKWSFLPPMAVLSKALIATRVHRNPWKNVGVGTAKYIVFLSGSLITVNGVCLC